MGSYLILAPFGAFALLSLVISAAASLFIAAGMSFVIMLLDVLRGGSVKIIAAGSVLLFSGIGCYVTLVDGHFSPTAIHLAVDIGVLAIVLLSLAIRLPFTLQYARERVDAETLK